MTAQDTLISAGPHAPAQSASWRQETAETVSLAAPIALTQLGQIAMMTTDLALLGRLGERVVAASALAHTVLFAAFVLGMGVVSAVAPLAAQAFGSRNPRLVRRALRVGLWAAVFLGVPLSLVQLYGREILIALGQTEDAAALAARYLQGLAWSLVPGWWFIALRSFMSAVNRPQPALWIMLAAIPVNAGLAYALIYGAFGFPELDLLGAGLATTIVNIGMCAACIWVAYACHPFRKYHVLGNFWRADWPLLWQLLAIGAPISGTFLLEYGLFATAALMMGWIGTTELAAHQIALTVASILFMVPFGISMAATVRVGQAVGRRDARATRRAEHNGGDDNHHHADARLYSPRFSGRRGSQCTCHPRTGGAASCRWLHILRRRRRTIHWRRCIEGPQRHPRSAALLCDLLLGDRLFRILPAGLSHGARRVRNLDRPVDKRRGLCRAADLEVSYFDQTRLSSDNSVGGVVF